MSEEKDCENTVDIIVCPYCGYEHTDCLHEYFGENEVESEIDCDVCEETFCVIREFTIDYSTSKIRG